MLIVAYVSGHGFGHAARVIEVLNAVRACRAEVDILVRTVVPRSFFDFNLRGPLDYAAARLDVGVVQPHGLAVDPGATLAAHVALTARQETLVAAEVAALAARRPSLVLADIPAYAFDVAARLGVPGIAIGNFSWDWIYADYVMDLPDYARCIENLRASYSRATLLLRLPLHGDMSTFPRIRDVPFVARHATVPPPEVRRRLSLPAGSRIVLLSFGGLGAPLPARPTVPAGVVFVSSGPTSSDVPTPWCREISPAAMRRAGIRYEDLVAAVDAVLTKPGYGIVAECIANGTAIVYTPRGRFAEYPVLVRGIEAHLPHATLASDELQAGRWRAALETVFAAPPRRTHVATDGAVVAARALLEAMAAG